MVFNCTGRLTSHIDIRPRHYGLPIHTPDHGSHWVVINNTVSRPRHTRGTTAELPTSNYSWRDLKPPPLPEHFTTYTMETSPLSQYTSPLPSGYIYLHTCIGPWFPNRNRRPTPLVSLFTLLGHVWPIFHAAPHLPAPTQSHLTLADDPPSPLPAEKSTLLSARPVLSTPSKAITRHTLPTKGTPPEHQTWGALTKQLLGAH